MNSSDIKEGRAILGITQEQLAYKVGVSVATLQRWERDEHIPSPMAVRKLKRLLKKVKVMKKAKESIE